MTTASDEEREAITHVLSQSQSLGVDAISTLLGGDMANLFVQINDQVASDLLAFTQTDSLEDAMVVASDFSLSQIADMLSANDDDAEFAQTFDEDLWNYDDDYAY